MAKSSAIRWRYKDIETFAKIRKNWNAKVSRLEKKGLPAPERIYKNDILTRHDFNTLKKDAESFTARGSEKLVKYYDQEIPKYEKERVTRMVRSVNAKKAYERKMLNLEKGTQTKKNRAETAKVNPKKKRVGKDWERFVKSLERQTSDKWNAEQAIQYKQNYMELLDKHLPQYADKIKSRIKNISPDKFAKGMYHDARLSIRYIYDPMDAEIKAEEIFNAWGEYLGYDDGIEFDYFDYDEGDDDFYDFMKD